MNRQNEMNIVLKKQEEGGNELFASLRNTMFADIIEDSNIVEHSEIIIREDGDNASDDEMFNNIHSSEVKPLNNQEEEKK